MSGIDMWEMTATLGEQLRAAARREPPEVPAASTALVCGMGGSGISGDFASVLAEVHGRRVAVHKGYGLPRWAREERPQVVAVSYSGNTEETLEAAREAATAGLDVVAVTSGGELAELAAESGWPCLQVPGGLQPRAALGHLLGAVLAAGEAAGWLPSQRQALSEAADLVDSLHAQGSTGRALATDLADALDGRIVVVYGSVGLTAPVAQRWKTQINENAKWPAWWSLLPELDHNEIVGWSSLAHLTRRVVGIVTLTDHADHPQVALRHRLTQRLTSGEVAWVGEVTSLGESELARMMSLVAVGDLVSLELAGRAGVDAAAVEVIERLKQLMRHETARKDQGET